MQIGEMRIQSGANRLDVVRELFREYAAGIGIDLCFQNFEEELRDLPGKYAEPKGRLYLALRGEEPAGCVALRPFGGRECEVKRLYVRERFRNLHLGQRLVATVIRQARTIGYDAMLLDTLSGMTGAQALYRKLGFVQTPPYYHNPEPGVIYMKRDLSVDLQLVD